MLLPSPPTLISSRSAVAGSVASAITSPLDMVKLRMQVRYSAEGMVSRKYNNILDGLLKTYRAEGVRGLFRGTLSRVLFHTPSTALTMALFETCKRWWLHLLT